MAVPPDESRALTLLTWVVGCVHHRAQEQYKKVGQDVAEVRTEHMKEQLATFRNSLEEFAMKYRSALILRPVSCVLRPASCVLRPASCILRRP